MSWTVAHKWIVRFGNDEYLTEEDLEQLGDWVDLIPIPTGKGSTLLHFASLTTMAHLLIPYLVERGAPVNVLNQTDATPLHWASRNLTCKRSVAALLKLGADPRAIDEDDNTALHYAAECGNVRAAKYLLARCPRLLHRRNNSFQTALGVACEHEQIRMINYLLSMGAHFEEFQLLVAIQRDAIRVIRALLAHDNPNDWSSETKRNILSVAQREKRKSVVRELSSFLQLDRTSVYHKSC